MLRGLKDVSVQCRSARTEYIPYVSVNLRLLSYFYTTNKYLSDIVVR